MCRASFCEEPDSQRESRWTNPGRRCPVSGCPNDSDHCSRQLQHAPIMSESAHVCRRTPICPRLELLRTTGCCIARLRAPADLAFAWLTEGTAVLGSNRGAVAPDFSPADN